MMRGAGFALLVVLTGCVSSTGTEPEETAPVDPDRSSVEVTPVRLVANGMDQALVTVTLVRSDGRPAAGEFIELGSTGTGNLIFNPSEGSGDDGKVTAAIASRVAERKTLTLYVGQPPSRVTLTQKPVIEFISASETVANLRFRVQPHDGVVGNPLTPPVEVELLDGKGHPVPQGSRTITISVGGTPFPESALAGDLSVTTENGVAVFSNLIAMLPAGNLFLVASAPDLPPVQSDDFSTSEGIPREPTALKFLTQPVDSVAGSAISPSPRVAIVDQAGQVVTSSDAEITVALAGNGMIAGTLSRRATSGIAVFDDVHVDSAGSGFRLVASSEGLAGTQSEVFGVRAGVLAGFAVSVVEEVVAGASLDVTVTAVDALGNPVTDYAGHPLLSSSDEDAVFSDVTAIGFVLGNAVWPDAATLVTAGTQTLRVTDMNDPGVDGSAIITVLPGAPSALAFTALPTTVEVRMPLGVQVSVVDAHGNAVHSGTPDVTITLESGQGTTLIGTASSTSIAGVAGFPELALDGESTGVTLRAHSVMFGDVVSESFTVVDTTPPSSAGNFRITGQTRSTLTYAFTSPGDDGNLGIAALYEVRTSTSPITLANFSDATFVFMGTAPAPLMEIGGNITGLGAGTLFHVGLVFRDSAGNASLSTTTGTTDACAAGYSGADCSTCAAGFHRDGSNACVDACTSPNPCTMPPAATCSGNVATQRAQTGMCSVTTGNPGFSCTYAATNIDCAASGNICVNGACIADPCAGFTCTPPAPSCAGDNITLTTNVSACIADGPGAKHCANTSSTTNCASTGKVCASGACVTASSPGAGDLLITEIMHRPSNGNVGKWVELRSMSSSLLNVAGMQLRDAATGQSFTLPSSPPVLVPPGGYLVLGSSTDASANGGARVDVAWGGFMLGSAGDLRVMMGTAVVDALVYDSGFPQTMGAAMQLSSSTLESRAHAQRWFWCDSTSSLSGGGKGTPGAANGSCGVAPAGTVDWCVTQFPSSLGTIAAGLSGTVYGRFYEPTVTTRNSAGNDLFPGVDGEVGFGTDAANPSAWTWSAADFNPAYVDSDPTTDNDEMLGTLRFPSSGAFLYGYRFRLGAAGAWRYCDLNGPASPPAAGSYGTVTVMFPVVSSTSHAYLPRGSTFTISGSGFSVVTRVLVGNVAQPFTIVDATTIRVNGLDAMTPMGTQALVLETAGSPSSPVNVRVVSLSADASVVAHGSRLAVTGLDGVTSASIGGVMHSVTSSPNTAVIDPVLDAVPVGAQSFSVNLVDGSSAPVPLGTVIHLVISELDADQVSTDTAEFIEVSTGVPNADLGAYSIAFINGGTDTVYRVINLAGRADANGLFVVGNMAVSPAISFAQDTLQNGPDAVGIYQSNRMSVSNGSALTSSGLVDAIEYGNTATSDPELLSVLLGAGPEAVHAVETTTTSLKRCGTARRDGRVFSSSTPSPGALNTCP